MAGGAGGIGASPNGANGLAGTVEPQGTTQTASGGTGGTNGFVIKDGSNIYGPYGTGGTGGGATLNSISSPGVSPALPGSDGGVILVWGGGNYGTSYSYPVTISATSPGISEGGGGPNGSPGVQYNTSNSNPVSVSYDPVSPHFDAGSNFAWSRSLAFVNPQTKITQAEMNAWGFDPADVVTAFSILLNSFSAGVDSSFNVGYALIAHGSADISAAGNFTLIANLSDPQPDRHFRSSNSNPYSYGPSPYGLGPWSVPLPDADHLLYIWTQDGSGTDTRTITVTYTA